MTMLRQMKDGRRLVWWDEEKTIPVMIEDYRVTCHTEGCENAEIPIDVTALAEDPHVVCGVCVGNIEDVVLL